MIKRNFQTFNLIQSSSMRIGRIFSRNSSYPPKRKLRNRLRKLAADKQGKREREREMVVKKERRDRKWKTNASRKQVRDGVKHLCKKNIWKEDDEGSNDETSEKFSTLSGDLSGFFSKWNCIFEIMQEIPSKFGCAKFSPIRFIKFLSRILSLRSFLP